jgi:hypothetical protein
MSVAEGMVGEEGRRSHHSDYDRGHKRAGQFATPARSAARETGRVSDNGGSVSRLTGWEPGRGERDDLAERPCSSRPSTIPMEA